MLVGLAVRSAGVMLYASGDTLTAHANVLGKKTNWQNLPSPAPT